MTKTTTLSALALLLASGGFAGAAHAQHGPGHHGGNPGQMLEQIDTNGDGDITRAEADAFRAARFADADANNDGVLTQDELTAHHEAERAERRAARQSEMFARMDADGDGVISEAELGGERIDRLFEHVDTDGDGVITEEERETAHENRPDRRGERRGRGDGQR